MIIDTNVLFANCTAELQQATMVQPERTGTLREMCVAGAEHLGIDIVSDPYKSRLDHELSVIEGKDFEDYFFLMADLMQWARKNMTTGPGRGSAAGSLVSYLLGITRVDPIKHDLLFFRFLDPSRNDTPDIDVDLSDRDAAIDYLVNKYGLHRVAKLGTVGNWQSLNATNEVAKALDLPRFAFNGLIDSLPSYAAGDDRADTVLAVALEETGSGQAILDKYPNFSVVKHMVGQPSHAGQHAAGVLVVNDAIDRYVAVDSRTNATMCDMRATEALGLLKLDLLGLKTLSVIEETLRQVGMKPDDLDQLPLDDQAAFDVLNDGKFLGIFQFEGHALRNLTRTICVTSFDDLSILSALSRPGASVGADAWVRRKKGEEEVTYPHEKLRPYLEKTLGVIAYQEQIMLIAKDIGNLSWEQVTKLRKAIGKSQGEEALRPFEVPFKKGFADNGIDEETTNRVWRQILDAGSYGFNKCLAGSTVVRVANPNGSMKKYMTIKELYEMYVGNPTKSVKEQRRRPELVSLFPDGRGYPQRAWDFVYSGIKECWKYTFDDGSEVICTPEHKFLVNGEWRPIGQTVVNDSFQSLVKEEQHYGHEGPGQGHIKGKKYNKPNRGFLSGQENPAWDNGRTPAFKNFKNECVENNLACEVCNDRSTRMEVHHRDFNSGRDRPDDLAWLCVSCHKKAHYANGRTKRWERGMRPDSKRLVSIDYHGWVETYDIEMPEHHNFLLGNGLVTHNSHSVSYGYVSYWTCWLKAHYPLEFAAASLTLANNADKQMEFLRELSLEGVTYVPVDPANSTDKWRVVGGKLIGPLQNIIGLGPKKVKEVLSARARGEPLSESLQKKLQNPQTALDKLFPLRDYLKTVDMARYVVQAPLMVSEVRPNGDWQRDVRVIGIVEAIKERDENEEQRVQDRIERGQQGVKSGFTQFIEVRLKDDSSTNFYAKIGSRDYHGLRNKVDSCVVGKTVVVMKGTVPPEIAMLLVENFKIIGEME